MDITNQAQLVRVAVAVQDHELAESATATTERHAAEDLGRVQMQAGETRDGIRAFDHRCDRARGAAGCDACPMDEYLAINRANWDERAPAHAASPDYAIDRFIEDPAFLSEVVRFDSDRLGEITGLTGVHLQCHIGTDTVSLARLGARMTGLDLSPRSLREARDLAERTHAAVRFVEADVYSALDVLEPGSFDLVYTGIGALCWLPDIARWARTVAGLLRPGGRLFVRDKHPMLATIDDSHADLLVVGHPYFERAEPMVFDGGGTYVETDVTFAATRTHEWSHGLGETISALHGAGMQLTQLVEHDSVPWQALPGQMSRDEHGEWRLRDRPWRLAASFTLQARRP
jgi:SAM-dependent methyltransferase